MLISNPLSLINIVKPAIKRIISYQILPPSLNSKGLACFNGEKSVNERSLKLKDVVPKIT